MAGDEVRSSPCFQPEGDIDQLLESGIGKPENFCPPDRRAAIGDANPNLKAAWPGRPFDKPKVGTLVGRIAVHGGGPLRRSRSSLPTLAACLV
jgi:hypothetical protein